jgi:ABC-type bacteriocin/lantibiotic exporter with double-glycine peptidase domain
MTPIRPYPFALALCLVAGCATTAPATRAAFSSEARVLDLPFLEQDEMYACGLVSVQVLCSYWNVPIDAAERARLAHIAETEEGITGGQLRESLEGLGFETYLFHGTLDHDATGLFRHVDERRPPLVMLTPEPERRHYVLVIGYDEPERNICLLDPVRGRVIVPYETFETSWAGCERFTLLAVPRPPDDTTTTAKAEAP